MEFVGGTPPRTQKARSFDVKLHDRLNRLSCSVLGRLIDSTYRPPEAYTGEFFGVEYLLNESNDSIGLLNLDKDIEGGMDPDFPQSAIVL